MIGVIGSGAFGTALAIAEAEGGQDVTLWGRNVDWARENPRLPGVTLPGKLRTTSDLGDLKTAKALLLVLPAQQTSGFLAENGETLPNVPLILCAKGLETGTGRMQSQIAADLPNPLAVLTGPGFAGEIARGLPTALTLAGGDKALQERLSTPRLRLYRSDDMTGAQLGGALKNVTAIACGLTAGAGLGESARAAVMTRGFAEIRRLALAMGAQEETLMGLSGLGDLALTAASRASRNFDLGWRRATGEADGNNTVEGVATAEAALLLGKEYGVDLPLAAAVTDVLKGALPLDAAMQELLSRPLKAEE
ncbi:NAD(P)H-dependent glycerol-3-phosphate dehydrogenase [Paracoccaceae bacterium GXU_MW_L88]